MSPADPQLRDLPRRPLLLLGGGLCVAVLALGLLTITARAPYRALSAAAQAQQHSYEVLLAIRQLRQHVGEARVGYSGYMLTGDSLYRATYAGGVRGIGGDTSRLRELTRREPTMQPFLDRLSPRLVTFATAMASGLAPRPERPTHAGILPAARTRDIVLLEAVRREFVGMEREQSRLMASASADVDDAVSRSTTVTNWILAGAAILILGIGVLMLAHLYARERTAEQQRRLEQQLQQSQRLEAIGRLAGGVAHDFNNILAAIMGFAELIDRDLPRADPVREDVAEITRAAKRARDLTRQLLAFSRKQVLELRVLSLNDVVNGVSGMLTPLLGDDIKVEFRLTSGDGTVRGDEGQLEQVLVNLALNARDAMPDGGQLTIETRDVDIDALHVEQQSSVPPGSYIQLCVTDTGIGMAPEVRQHVFEPFFTTKGPDVGTGLGLATVYGIVTQSDGYIEVYSERGHGTTFKIYLPRLLDERAPRTAGVHVEKDFRRGTETILLVEDDDAVARVTAATLRRHGYTVLIANRPADALTQLAHWSDALHLLVSDVVMPGMSGPQLAERIVEHVPDIRVLFVSGYSEVAIARHGVLAAGAAFLQKPFTAELLLRTVRSVLDVQTAPFDSADTGA